MITLPNVLGEFVTIEGFRAPNLTRNYSDNICMLVNNVGLYG